MKDSLINTLEDVARDVRMGLQTTGIEKLQTIMTEAKEKVSASRRLLFQGPGISLLNFYNTLRHELVGESTYHTICRF